MTATPRARPSHFLATVLVASSISTSRNSVAQTSQHEPEVVQSLAESVEDAELTSDYDLSEMADLLNEPLDLNVAAADQFTRIPGLSVVMAERIAQHRRRQGPFSAVDSLEGVPGITKNTIEDIRPFVRVLPPGTGRRYRARLILRHRMRRRLDLGKGFDDQRKDSVTRYLGGPIEWTTRARINVGDFLTAHLGIDHDSGEPLVWRLNERRLLADFFSWSVEVRPNRFVRSVVFGDFRYSTVLGLAIRSADFSSFETPYRAISSSHARPFTGSQNTGRYRGVAIRLQVGRLEGGGFVSVRRRDATVDTTVNGSPYVTLGTETDRHRTATEIRRRGALSERLVGVHLGLHLGSVLLGGGLYRLGFGLPVVRGERGDQAYDFGGKGQQVLVLDVRSNVRRVHFVVEGVRSTTSAGITTARINPRGNSLAFHCWLDLPTRTRFWLYGRRLGPGGSVLAAPLARSAVRGQPERGLSFGFRTRPAQRLMVVAYSDFSWHPWLRFGLSIPSSEAELGLRLERSTQKNYLSVKMRTRRRDVGIIAIDVSGRQIKSTVREHSYRISVRTRHEVAPRTQLRIAAAVARSHRQSAATNTGAMLLLSSRYDSGTVSFTAGIVLHQSSSDDTRLFAYEPDVRFAFQIRGYSGRGERWYLLISARLGALLTIQAKYSSATRYGARAIGSGLDEVTGNQLREVGFQIVLDTN